MGVCCLASITKECIQEKLAEVKAEYKDSLLIKLEGKVAENAINNMGN